MFIAKLIRKLQSERGAVDTSSESGANTDTSAQGTEKVHGLVQDLDFSKVPDNIKSDVIKFVTEKTKEYDTAFRTKTTSLKEEKEALEKQKESRRDLDQLYDEIQANPALSKKALTCDNCLGLPPKSAFSNQFPVT